MSSRVVFVEDCPLDAEMARRGVVTTKPDVEVDWVSDEPGFWRSLKQDVSLIVLDLHLPSVSGLKLLRDLRRKPVFQHIPVVVFSGSRDPQAFAQALAEGAEECCSKPMNAGEFLETVRGFSQRWLVRNN